MKRFFKDFFIYGFSSVLSKVISIFLLPIFTSILTREEYGYMALIMSCYGILDLFSNLNIHSGVGRDYYEKDIDRKKLVSTGLYSELFFSLSLLLFMLVTREFWAYTVLGLESEYMVHFCIMLVSVPLGGIKLYFSILTRYKNKPVLFSIVSVISVVLQLTLNIIGVVYLRLGVITLFVSVIVVDIFGAIVYGYVNRDLLAWTFDKKYLKRILLFSIPTLPAICAGWIDTSLGQILIGRYISAEELGVYSIALSLASGITIMSTAFQNVWSPYLYENYGNDNFRKEVKRLFVSFVLLLMMVMTCFSLFGEELILLLTTPDYMNAVKYMIILFVPLSFYMLFPIASSGINIARQTKKIGVSYVWGSLLNLSFLLVSIKNVGIIAVPLCLCISRISTYLILYHYSKKTLNYQLPNYYLIALCALALFCYFINMCNFNIYVRIIIFIILSSLLLWRINVVVDIKTMLGRVVSRKSRISS